MKRHLKKKQTGSDLKMRKFILLISVLLIVTSCAPSRDSGKSEDNEPETEEATEEKVSIIPNYKVSENQYQIMLPYQPSEARGTITNQIANRLDIDEMEEGLRRHSVKSFNPDDHFFEEGQYLTTDFIFDKIEENNPDQKKLKSREDHENNPRIFSHILEQNYLKKTNDDNVELAGVSFGIALKSVYRYQTKEGGPFYEYKISKKEATEKGEEIASNLVKELRKIEELENVPMMIALYQEESVASQVPGNFIKQANVKAGSDKLGKWENIAEKYVQFPSTEGKKNYVDDYEKVNKFGTLVAEYFPNYVGVIGEGLYIEDNLISLSINIPIEFYGKNEIIGFTQYIYGLADKTFSKNHELEIKVTSSNQVESILYREANEDKLNVHILH